MSNQQNKSGSSRNSRGGNRRRPQGGNRGRRSSDTPKPKAAPKPTFGQKVLMFFSGGRLGQPSENQNTGRPKQGPPRRTIADTEAAAAAESGAASTRGGHADGGGGGGGGRDGSDRSRRNDGGGKGGTRPPRERKPREKRPPEIVEVTTPRLYVGNLSFDAEEKDLQDLFGGVGTVQLAEIVTNHRTQRSKGYGFVEMISVDEAKRAVETLHDKDFMGRPMVVSGAKSTGPKTAADS